VGDGQVRRLTTARLLMMSPVVAGLYLVSGILLPPGWAPVAVIALSGVLCCAAIVTGLRRHRPSYRLPWWCVLTGSLINLTGLALVASQKPAGIVWPVPGPPDAVYIWEYPILAAAPVLWMRRRGDQDVAGRIDVAMIIVGLATLCWPVLLVPAIDNPGIAQGVSITSGFYIFCDLMLFGSALRASLGIGRIPPALGLLAASLSCFLAGDTLTTFDRAYLQIGTDPYAEAIWVMMPLFAGAAALHPSMALLHHPARNGTAEQSGGRLLMLGLPLLVGPAALTLGHAAGDDRYVVVYSAASAVLSALVMARMWLMVRQQRTLAVTDGLTGLRTRRYFEESLATAVARHARTPEPFGVLLLDVDYFKRVNDTRGHHGGDRVLRELARRLRDATRASDVVARYGGEEFAVLLSGAGPEETLNAAERIRAAVADQPVPMDDGPPQPVTVSVGVACLPGPAGTSAQLMLHADHCLYSAKHQGRNRVIASLDTRV
jgi:two-component system, cell cycle response regulator